MQNRTVTSTQTQEEELRSRLRVQLERDGGNPSQLLELIMIATKQRVWEAFGMSFPEFIETPFNDGGLGWSIANLKTVLTLRHRFEHKNTGHKDLVADLAEMRVQVTRLLMPAPTQSEAQMGNSNAWAGDTITKNESYNCNDGFSHNTRGNNEEYLTARIARDRPGILTDMHEGKYRSVRAAAIEAGIVKPVKRFSLPDTPEEAGKYLAERVGEEWIKAMLDSYYRQIK